ncbi:MAG: SGNH/GDSL hydrolase family protein [Deltaproteobacteria bacterium]|nr:MAG: SGNH/GDSL hydrolase family protein [Deltaproteobacteria bacterium]
MSRGQRRRRRGFRLAAILLGLVLAVALWLLAEGLLAMRGVQPAYQAGLLGGWRMLPEQHQHRVMSREGASFVLSTNADGMRTTASRQRRADVWRVALMGDSIVFGWGVDDGGTVADGLQQALRERYGDRIEVINAAQPGYSTVQTAWFWRTAVREYRPDLLVVFLAMHDHNQVLISDAENLRGARGPLSWIRIELATRSRVYQALRQWLVPLHREPFLLPDQRAGELRVPRVNDREREEALDGIAADLAGWGGRLALGHMPFIGDLEAGRAIPREGAEWAARYAADRGLAIIDLRACCGPGAGDLVLPNDPGHLRAEGNLAAGRYGADQVAAVLEAMGAPDGRPPGYGSSR